MRNAAGHRLDDQRAVIFDQYGEAPAVAQAVDEPARPRTLVDYNRPYQYYANISAIHPPAIQRNDFELKPKYFTLMAQTPYYGLSREHPMTIWSGSKI